MVYMLIQLYIIKKRKNLIVIFLGITNVLGVTYEFSLTGKEDPYYAFLFGGNVMIAHCIYLIASDFAEGMIQGLFVCSGKIIMTVIYSSYPNREINFATFTYFVLLEVLLYKCNQGLRQFYLLSLKSDHWQNLLIRLVDKHFICFYYDDKSLSFQQILSNNETISMKQIFRESKQNGQTIENLLFKLHKQQNFYNLKIDAIYNNRNIAFQLSQFYLDKPCYLAIIDYYEIRQEQLINRLLIQNIGQSSKLIRLFIRNRDWCILNRLYLRNLEIIYLYKCISNKIIVRDFNLTKLLRRYTNILSKCHNDIKMYCFINDDINIQYFKEEIKLFFIRIFNQIKPNNSIFKILMIRDNNRAIISIDGSINPNFIQGQSELIQKIFESYKINEDCKFLIQLELILYLRID